MIFVLLPAYNEEKSLPALLPKIDAALRTAGLSYQLIVGDDGSSDGTGNMLLGYSAQYPLEIVTHKRNRGLGETSRDLFERVSELCSPDDIIVQIGRASCRERV